MCCFSGEVEHVGATRIFARHVEAGRQAVAYAMNFSAGAEVAMLLPIPTIVDSAEDAVRFVDLHENPQLFDHLDRLFPPPPQQRGARSDESLAGGTKSLEVHQVGAFEASFVPRLADMSRLDARFRLPEGAWQVLARRGSREQVFPRLTQAQWDALPNYSDWGFCVFKLRAGAEQEVHPMAFTFPSRWPKRLFFPTVHVHDGTFPVDADFDHTLYLQTNLALDGRAAVEWEESRGPAHAAMDVAATKGLVEGAEHVYRRKVRGSRPNQDVVVVTA
jgi:hypothetical protein